MTGQCVHKQLGIAACLLTVNIVTVLAHQHVAVGADRPNVVFIMTDQQSADIMSCRMGDQYLHTPTMDQLARQGMVFTRAYSPNPLCMPARASIFTGRYPHETGVTKNALPAGGQVSDEFICMAQYLRAAGYQTAYSGKWHLCFPQKDVATHGFEILNSKRKLVPSEDNNHDSRVAQAAVEFLRQQHDQPFLLVVSFLNPHNICEWARRAAGREQKLNCGEIGTPPAIDQLPPAPANLEVPRNEPDGMLFMRRAYQVDSGLFPVSRFTAEDWRRQRWGYYRMVEKVDGEIGKVMQALREAGVEEETVVIFTSDHGDCVGAHRFNQKTVFYDESVRVPLIVSWKGKTAGATSDKLVNTGLDILPTMMACARITQPEKLPGRNLLPIALGQPEDTWREYVVSENDMVQSGEVDAVVPTMQGRMVRTDRYKYCLYEFGTQREALYDLQSDPLETLNLATDPKYRPIVLQQRGRLREFAHAHHDPLVDLLLADDAGPRPFQ